jgi:PleD family two-component response regulator
VALLTDTTVKDALHVAQRMVGHIERTRQSLQQAPLSISFGVVQIQPDEALTDAIRRASQALDEARSQGDSRFVSAEDDDGMPVFSPSQPLGHSGF